MPISSILAHDIPAIPCHADPPAAPQPGTCRQVITTEGVNLKTHPCFTLGEIIPGLPPNEDLGYLQRGSTVTYTNTDSKQTSRCVVMAPPLIACVMHLQLPKAYCTPQCQRLLQHGFHMGTYINGAIL